MSFYNMLYSKKSCQLPFFVAEKKILIQNGLNYNYDNTTTNNKTSILLLILLIKQCITKTLLYFSL